MDPLHDPLHLALPFAIPVSSPATTFIVTRSPVQNGIDVRWIVTEVRANAVFLNNQELEILRDFGDLGEAQMELEALRARNRGLEEENREMKDEMEVLRARDS